MLRALSARRRGVIGTTRSPVPPESVRRRGVTPEHVADAGVASRAVSGRPDQGRGDNESPERSQGSPEDPGTRLGTAVPRARLAVRHRLHLREGPEEGPAEAGPPFLLPDAGREGQPRVRRAGWRHPRQHVPPGSGALAGVAEAVPVDHPVAGDLRRAGYAAAVQDRPEPGTAQRPGDPDDRRGPALDDP